MTVNGGTTAADWMLGLAVQALARRLLSGRPATETLVRALRVGLRHGRDQQQLLPSPGSRDVRAVGVTRADALPVRGEGQPIPHPHEEVEGSGRAGRAVLRPGEGTA